MEAGPEEFRSGRRRDLRETFEITSPCGKVEALLRTGEGGPEVETLAQIAKGGSESGLEPRPRVEEPAGRLRRRGHLAQGGPGYSRADRLRSEIAGVGEMERSKSSGAAQRML
jgi:hypothetical protein